MDNAIDQKMFKGIRNDFGDKFIDDSYFFDSINFNQDDIIGANKDLAPYRLNSTQFNSGKDIDGIFEYKYLNTNNALVTENIIISGGNIYKDFYKGNLVTSGIEEGKCKFAIYQDKLFIANGKNYPKIYNGSHLWEMGAPEAVINGDGSLTGQYYYCMTYVTSGGEEVIGTKSNIVNLSNNQIKLNLPIGYAGTLQRKLYRTQANGSYPKLLATITDNNTLVYYDNDTDDLLSSNIPEINNECPKPYFIEVSYNNCLVGSVCDKYPTQAFVTGIGIEVFDSANYIDVSNRSGDNTALKGMCQDYNLIVIGSEKQIYTLNTDDPTEVSVNVTRCNIGVFSGYSMAKCPSNEIFGGGVMFVSSDRTVRLLNGNFAQPLTTQLDNIKTENWAQQISGSLSNELKSCSNIDSIFLDFKYHLSINSKIYTFDLRTLGWMTHEYRTENYLSNPNVFAVINNELYNGQKGASYVEKMYSSVQYMEEDLVSKIEFPYWLVSEDYKDIKTLILYFSLGSKLDATITVYIDDDIENPIMQNLKTESSGVFDPKYFSSSFFDTGVSGDDYRIIYINRRAKWIKPVLTINSGGFYFKGISLQAVNINNKEA